MSVGVSIELDISKLSSRDQAGQVREAVQTVMEDEGIRRQVPVWTREEDGKFLVLARSAFPVIIRGFSRWESEFQERVKAAVETVTTEAYIDLYCFDPDIEKELNERRL